jgi:Sulfotransferase domain
VRNEQVFKNRESIQSGERNRGMAMIRRLVAAAKRAFGLHRPGRNLIVFPDDVFLVSYPKSGNTWARFLIANLMHPEQAAEFSSINKLIPEPEAVTKRDLDRCPRPRIIKSHQYLDPRYQRVIYIVRDPRDVVLSQFHFQRKRKLIGDDYPLEQFVNRFVAGETSPYGSWGENVGSWLATRHGQPGFLLLRYEDMVADTAPELGKIAAFLGIPATPQQLSQAVERSSADRMRKLEKSQAHLFSSTKDTRQDIPFVRSAKAGGWRSALPEACALKIEDAWAPMLRWLGYELISGDKTTVADSPFSISAMGEPIR